MRNFLPGLSTYAVNKIKKLKLKKKNDHQYRWVQRRGHILSGSLTSNYDAATGGQPDQLQGESAIVLSSSTHPTHPWYSSTIFPGFELASRHRNRLKKYTFLCRIELINFFFFFYEWQIPKVVLCMFFE